jgi:polyisoprenyl-phosphate glycosyltransferase
LDSDLRVATSKGDRNRSPSPDPDPECFVSVVAPLFDDADIVEDFVEEVVPVLASHYTNYEIVLIDDGSTDGTAGVVSRLLEIHQNIRLLRLSRHFGEEVAISAGLDSVIGDYCVVMIPATDPGDIIPDMVARSRAGVGVVYGIRSSRRNESWPYRAMVRVFYWVCQRLVGVPIPSDSTHLRVLSRQAVNAITRIQDRGRYLTTLSAYVGFEEQAYLYEPITRRAKPRRKSLMESVSLAVTIVVSNSTIPLRIAAWLGFALATVNVVYMVFVLIVYVIKESPPVGWSTMSMVNAVMFFFVLLILAVVSEYLGRLIGEQPGRPLYYVRDEASSASLATGMSQRNVVTDARGTGG